MNLLAREVSRGSGSWVPWLERSERALVMDILVRKVKGGPVLWIS
jgi:hypothetical protein